MDPGLLLRSSSPTRYYANLTKGSLKPTETKIVAELFNQGLSPTAVIERLVDSNDLQKRSPASSLTLGSYLLKRLDSCPASVVTGIVEGNSREMTQFAFVAACAESRLLRDFLLHQVGPIRKSGRRFLTNSDWADYISWAEGQDENVAGWTEGVLKKLRQNVWRILHEVGIVDSTKTLHLQTLRLEESVRICLQDESLYEVAMAIASGGGQ